MGTTHDNVPDGAATDGVGAAPGVLSLALWGVVWGDLLPVEVTRDGVVAQASTFEAAAPFIRDHYREIFDEQSTAAPFATRVSDNKARYYRTAGDFFEFVHGGRTVALLIGNPVDWETYYIRSAASLPEYQGKRVVQRFLPILFERLKLAGVKRVEAETSPANLATTHWLTRMRFNATGTTLSERWGAMVHYTKFLDEESEDTFLRQFTAGVQYQKRAVAGVKLTRKGGAP